MTYQVHLQMFDANDINIRFQQNILSIAVAKNWHKYEANTKL